MGRLESAPPILIVRPTQYPNGGGGIWSGTGKGVFVNASVDELAGIAYGFGRTRMVLPADVPAGSYDYLATLPNHQNDALKQELKKQFQIVAHRETRQTEVLLLKVKNPAALNAHVSKGVRTANYIDPDGNVQNFIFENLPCSRLIDQFEGYFQKPILDRTGTPRHYDLTFHWPAIDGGSASNRLERIRQEVQPQFERYGFELVPSREPVELLIVERVTN